MYVYARVDVYVHVSAREHLDTYTCIYTYTHIYMYMYIGLYMNIYIYIYVHMPQFIYAFLCVCLCVHVYVYLVPRQKAPSASLHGHVIRSEVQESRLNPIEPIEVSTGAWIQDQRVLGGPAQRIQDPD